MNDHPFPQQARKDHDAAPLDDVATFARTWAPVDRQS